MKNDIIALLCLCIIYIISLFVRTPGVFTYRFDPHVVEKYMHSQDITHEVVGRVFTSDSDGNNALGYIYMDGGDPVWYNFQHGPFIKYLFGFSTKIWGNPYITQILFGILLISMVYLFGKKWHSRKMGGIAGFFLIADPLMASLTSQFLLDLGQAALIMLYLYLILFHKRAWLAQGLVFGVLCASKFWAAPLFFFLIIHGYLFIQKELRIKQVLLQLGVAAVAFSLVYIRSFIVAGGFFNIVFFQLKTIKFWLTQSVSSTFGATTILFMTGYFKMWWGDFSWARAAVWFVAWPALLIASTVWGIRRLWYTSRDWKTLFALIPLLYLGYIGVQAPFERYYIIILPFLYLAIAGIIGDIFLKGISQKKKKRARSVARS